MYWFHLFLIHTCATHHLWRIFFRESCILCLDLTALLYFTIHIVNLERVSYCISLLLILNHLTLTTKYTLFYRILVYIELHILHQYKSQLF